MYEYEEPSDIIGLHCTLLNPYKGYTEGTIVGDYGNTIVIRLTMVRKFQNTVTK